MSRQRRSRRRSSLRRSSRRRSPRRRSFRSSGARLLRFPEGFEWGVATAAPQIEGARAERGTTIWDTFAPGALDVACDHYHRMEEDVARIRELGVAVYRFSIAWARVWPDGTRGSESAEGVDFYRRLLSALERANVRACVTLYHWDLPEALERRGGWRSPESPEWFEAYARRCYELFDGPTIAAWITLNEPWCVSVHGFCSGSHAPGRRQAPGTEPYRVAHHLLLAHARAYRAYRGDTPVGITLNTDWAEPARAGPRDAAACARYLDFTLGWFASPIFLTGDYPPGMRERVVDRLPRFSAEESRLLRDSADFSDSTGTRRRRWPS